MAIIRLIDQIFYLTDEGIFDQGGVCPDWDTLLLIKSRIDELLAEYTKESLTLAIEEAVAEREQESEERRRIERLHAKAEKERPKPTKNGFVYLMVDRSLGYYKIGFSTDPKYRERTLQADKPTIEMLFSYPATMREEEELHKTYTSQRVRGEWFRLRPDDLGAIKARMETLQCR